MTVIMETAPLDGRLPLLGPADLNGGQRALYDRLVKTMVAWADQSGLQSMTEDERLIGPFNAILFSPDVTSAFLDLQEAERAHTSLGERVRQVVILSVGAVWRSAYELCAHAAVAHKAGIPDDIVRALASGGVPDGLGPAEKLASCFARALFTGHRIDPCLYKLAEAAFGPKGLVDLIVLAGCYHTVCGLLTAFEVPAPDGQPPFVPSTVKQAKLTTIALFPVKSFLENLAVRHDNSVLVTSMNAKELLYIRTSSGDDPVEPLLLHRFNQPTTGLVEIEPDLFLVSTSNLYTTHESYLHRVDLRSWRLGSQAPVEEVFRFPDTARGLNGSCLLAQGIVLIADCFAGLIWRIDLGRDGREIEARTWLEHSSMDYFPGKLKPEQPGVNGVRYAARSSHLYYTSTAKKLLMRLPVHATTFEPSGEPELVVAGRMGDDFCIDEDAGIIYLATHRQNTIDRISMDPSDNSGFPQSVAGDPFTDTLIGPSSGAWSRAPGEYGKVAYFISDGGTASPPAGGPQQAKLQRVEF